MDRDTVPRLLLLGLLASLFPGGTGMAAPGTVEPPPHFASLSSDKVYMREGPTYDHRVLWIYRRKGLPVEILAAFDVWRRVEDAHGTIGWIHSSMLSDRRTVVVLGSAKAPLRASPTTGSHILALAQPGAIARLEACDATACEVSADGIDGWIDKRNIWGVGGGEVFN